MGGPDILNNQGAGASSGGKVINIIAYIVFCVARDWDKDKKYFFPFLYIFLFFLNCFKLGSLIRRGAGEFLYAGFFYFRASFSTQGFIYLRGGV